MKILQYMEKFKKYLVAKNFLILVGVLFFLFYFLQINRAIVGLNDLREKSGNLIVEVGEMRAGFGMLGDDLSEVRRYLGLPVGNYITERVEDQEDAQVDQLEMAMFRYVEYLIRDRENAERLSKNKANFELLAVSEDFKEFLAAGGLRVSEQVEGVGVIYLEVMGEDGAVLIRYELDLEEGFLSRMTMQDDERIKEVSYGEFENEEMAFIRTNKLRLQNHLKVVEERLGVLRGIKEVESIKALILELGIDIKEDGLIVNGFDDAIGSVVLDKKSGLFELVDLKDADNGMTIENLDEKFEDFLRGLDTVSEVEKGSKDALLSVKKTLEDRGFLLLLEESGLRVSEMREDGSRIYFDIVSMEGEVVSSLAIEKMTGLVKVIEGDENKSLNILNFDPEFKKKTLEIPDFVPEYGEAHSKNGRVNILLAGKHGSLIDTMIFVHINEDEKKMHFISIPRDLYYEGRKINALAMVYGMPELKRAISKISGYELDYYVLIDMYAFIDVVDLIGGVEVTLDRAVVDPSYRVVDNGVEGTLNYPAGTYHLGGVEALRLARSRKTSSDFARAERQQMIVGGIKEKVKELGLMNIDTLYAISRSAMKQVETDMNFNTAIAYYFRYRDYEIASSDVMSSGNVLMSPPYMKKEQCEERSMELVDNGEEALDCGGQNVAYTLVPRNNNWDVVKWFFRERFK